MRGVGTVRPLPGSGALGTGNWRWVLLEPSKHQPYSFPRGWRGPGVNGTKCVCGAGRHVPGLGAAETDRAARHCYSPRAFTGWGGHLRKVGHLPPVLGHFTPSRNVGLEAQDCWD